MRQFFTVAAAVGVTRCADGIGLHEKGTFAGGYLGRHLPVANLSNGSFIFAFDWRSSENNIERIVLSDSTISTNFLKANINDLPDYLGRVSRSQVTGAGYFVPNAADTAEAIS